MPTQTDYIYKLPVWATLSCLILVVISNLIGLCGNSNSYAGVRPYMPPSSLISLHAFTNTSSWQMISSRMTSWWSIWRYSMDLLCLSVSIRCSICNTSFWMHHIYYKYSLLCHKSILFSVLEWTLCWLPCGYSPWQKWKQYI